MSLFYLLEYDFTLHDTWFGKTDPRLKLLYSIGMLIGTIFYDNLLVIGFLFILNSIIFVKFIGIDQYIRSFFVLRWFVFFFLIITYIIQGTITKEIIIILVQIYIISNSFVLFNKTTPPELFFTTLIKLKIPVKYAWNITGAIRQAILTIDELQYIREIYRLRNSISHSTKFEKFKFQIKEVIFLFTNLFSRSILISEDYALTLRSRGWQKPRNDLSLFDISITKNDGMFFLIILLLPLMFVMILRWIY